MTVNSTRSAALRVQISPRDRRAILNNVLAALQKRFYSPEKLNADWEAAVDRCRPTIENANITDDFEQSMSDLLSTLPARATRPAIARAMLLFPLPFGPMMATHSPARTEKLARSTATKSPYVTFMSVTRSCTGPGSVSGFDKMGPPPRPHSHFRVPHNRETELLEPCPDDRFDGSTVI